MRLLGANELRRAVFGVRVKKALGREKAHNRGVHLQQSNCLGLRDFFFFTHGQPIARICRHCLRSLLCPLLGGNALQFFFGHIGPNREPHESRERSKDDNADRKARADVGSFIGKLLHAKRLGVFKFQVNPRRLLLAELERDRMTIAQVGGI
jgi:hypothetical protein